MVNYENGKIYKLVIGDLTYIGSTVQSLAKRKGGHKGNFNMWLEGRCNFVSSFKLFELGNPDIILIENCPCENKEELHRRERYYIESIECVNKVIPTRTGDEYREANRKKYSEYYENNKDKLKEQSKVYYENNKETIIKKHKLWKESNKDKVKKQRKVYYEDNKEKFREKSKQYKEANKEKLAEKVMCVCGSTMRYDRLGRHKRTNKHQAYLTSLTTE